MSAPVPLGAHAARGGRLGATGAGFGARGVPSPRPGLPPIHPARRR